MRENFLLDNTILKSNEAFTLYRSDKASVEISKDALALPIKRKDEKAGYVFYGQGKLLVDAIVETEKGAFGKPIQRALEGPFLMLGDTEETSQHLSSASENDLKKVVANEKMLLDRSQELLDRFSHRSAIHGSDYTCRDKGQIFAFPNGETRLDTLVSEGSKLVYATKELSFVSNGDKSILSSSKRVVLFDHGRSLFIDTPHLPHTCC